MLKLNKRGVTLLEIAVGGAMAGAVGVAAIHLAAAGRKAGGAALLTNQAVLLQQRLAAAGRIPEYMQTSAQADMNMNFCVNVRGDNASNSLCTSANCCNTGLVRGFDMRDPGGILIAGNQTPARYDAALNLCPPNSPPSAACPLAAYASYSASCPPIAGTTVPQAVCKQTALTNIQLQFIVREEVSVGSSNNSRAVASIAGTGNSCADGYTMIGVDSAGLPICVYHSAGACPLGSFLWSYNPQLTTNNYLCRSLASLCPAGYTWQGLDQNNAGNGVNANGNAAGWCVQYGVSTCAGQPNGYVVNVDFANKHVDCVTPAFTNCGVNTLQEGNYPNGAPYCVAWDGVPSGNYANMQLPQLYWTQQTINGAEIGQQGVRAAMWRNDCMAQPKRGLGRFNADATPHCNNPPSDFNGDGWPDLVVGAGDQGGPRVNVISGTDRATVLANFFAYDPNLRIGVSVGMTDINGDGYADVITLPNAPGGGPDLGIFYGPNPNNNVHKFVIDTSGNLRCGYSVGP